MNILQKIRDQLLLWANRLGTPVDVQYPKKWYEQMANDETFADDHDAVASILTDEFQPESVIDFGCGVGHTLAGFERRGVTIQGIEGSNVARELAVIDSSKIEVSDLRKPAKFGEYDLVVCMEVAEHLPEPSADTLVDTLIAHGETIVFTAATPGQGGRV